MQVNYPPSRFPLFAPPPPNALTGQPADSTASAPLDTLAPPGTDDGTFTDLGPLSQQQELAANALQEGSSTAPAVGGIATGLARMAEAISGGYNLGRANKKIEAAKQANTQVMLNALNNGDWAKLATSDNPMANKLGDSLLQAQLKHMQTDRILTPEETEQFGYPKGTVVSKNMNGEQKVLNRSTTGLGKGYMWNEDQSAQVPIPGGPADPAVIAANAGGRAAAVQGAKPKKPVAADESGVAPWLRKW